MSSSELLVILALCFIGYGLYRVFNNLRIRKATENKRKNEFQKSLINIADKNLAVILTYMYEQQKQDIKTITILIFIIILILTSHRH